MGRPIYLGKPVSISMEYTLQLRLVKVSCRYRNGAQYTTFGEPESKKLIEDLGPPPERAPKMKR